MSSLCLVYPFLPLFLQHSRSASVTHLQQRNGKFRFRSCRADLLNVLFITTRESGNRGFLRFQKHNSIHLLTPFNFLLHIAIRSNISILSDTEKMESGLETDQGQILLEQMSEFWGILIEVEGSTLFVAHRIFLNCLDSWQTMRNLKN